MILAVVCIRPKKKKVSEKTSEKDAENFGGETKGNKNLYTALLCQ